MFHGAGIISSQGPPSYVGRKAKEPKKKKKTFAKRNPPNLLKLWKQLPGDQRFTAPAMDPVLLVPKLHKHSLAEGKVEGDLTKRWYTQETKVRTGNRGCEHGNVTRIPSRRRMRKFVATKLWLGKTSVRLSELS
ncbi:hypothetical protein MAPG_09680 [Magnaporthiopsis poae ATCC 64411]|uniref:Uncharacterized protein n=1 Tax=Magnaporthiopsis poae (strain ATCC 64411 / 73-15) TaxID=644358 RepID=A0A0C4EAK5_MAGP6|nr:hypothetical protein MAPG_09680 [Magnaporthiopsis poae ATCC 64411]